MKAIPYLLVLSVLIPMTGWSQVAEEAIQLPTPNTRGGKPLMEALKNRKTDREFSAVALEPQMIADLLWAAYGINRPENGRRTAPSASNKQETNIYVVTAQGAYLWDAEKNTLALVITGDHRAGMGKQEFAGKAPLLLVFVADYSRMGKMDATDKDFYSAVDAGYISQNVYLYCASEGLSTVVLGYIDRDQISRTLKLPENCRVLLTQCVGFGNP